ncbi:hypothetical protein F4810DRAFT_712997 [Camillea tinctor]|nr:hypothetical protein F4810DRAFT_712997 [Camillea tinctor]
MASISSDSDMKSSDHLGSLHTATANDLLPAPLRIPQRKTDSISDDVEQSGHEIVDNLGEPSISTSHHQLTSQAPQPPPIHTTAPRRSAGSKLGSLVSKFEIMDAVNSAEARSNVNPGASPRSKREVVNQSLPSPVGNLPFSEDTSETSPPHRAAPITPKRSMIPISIRSKEAASHQLGASSPTYSPGIGVLDPFDYKDSEISNAKRTSSDRSKPNMSQSMGTTANKEPG